MTPGRILIVDDESSVAETIGAVLELDGYAVNTATRGDQALALLTGETFDLILTDLRLEDSDGLTILEEVRRQSPDTVVIMLTGYASLESAVRALREGAYDYLFKPCDVEELRATVRRGIERRQLGLQLQARVDELERASDIIRGFNRDLQQRVDAATAELRQRMDDLARANAEIEGLYRQAEGRVAELKKLDELKSRFLSMASHELKTPLTAVSGFAQILERRVRRRLEVGMTDAAQWAEDERVNLHQLELLRGQALKLSRLVDDLLDVSRIESGKVDFRYRPVDLRQLASDVIERMQLTSDAHQITVETPADAQTTIAGDEDYLEQVLNNLFSNAIKYSPEGGPIDVRVEPRDDSVLVSVRDRGIGIASDQLEAVFSLFHQATDGPGSGSGGMGLGLYISREIVGRHGGRIWAESRPGEGSTFHVELPRVPASEPATA